MEKVTRGRADWPEATGVGLIVVVMSEAVTTQTQLMETVGREMGADDDHSR